MKRVTSFDQLHGYFLVSNLFGSKSSLTIFYPIFKSKLISFD